MSDSIGSDDWQDFIELHDKSEEDVLRVFSAGLGYFIGSAACGNGRDQDGLTLYLGLDRVRRHVSLRDALLQPLEHSYRDSKEKNEFMTAYAEHLESVAAEVRSRTGLTR